MLRVGRAGRPLHSATAEAVGRWGARSFASSTRQDSIAPTAIHLDKKTKVRSLAPVPGLACPPRLGSRVSLSRS